ncbi:MAG: hypothetical protein VW518_00570, partial [Burkholderiaceae bacterium]
QGPGYASIQINSVSKTLRDRTTSGTLVARSAAYHSWEINIAYNPMTKEEFAPIYGFLLEKQGSLKPFYVAIPQYDTLQNSSFATYAASNNLETITSYNSGAISMILDGPNSYTHTSNGTPLPGDMFTISSTNSNHKKAYKVTRVETSALNQGTTPAPSGTGQVKIHFAPALQKDVENNADIVFHSPKVKVIQKDDVFSYSLGPNNLYSFGLSLEEVQ